MTASEFRNRRHSLGLTQEQLAARIGCQHTRISEIENGHRRARPQDIAALTGGAPRKALMLAGEGERHDCIYHNRCLDQFVRESPRAEAVHCPAQCPSRSDAPRGVPGYGNSALAAMQTYAVGVV